MSRNPDELASNLPGGYVLVGPAGARLLCRALDLAERQTARDGIAPPAAFVQVRDAFRNAGGTAEVPHVPDVAASSRVRWALADPVTTAQAAELLGCSTRNVRALCRRGTLTTARRDRDGWVVEKSEVAGRIPGHGRSATWPHNGSGYASRSATVRDESRR